jgi:predicted dehydrogenase/nucleoside-diphosphate-sugar epimerase
LSPKKLRTGLVGAGYVSSYHARAVQSLDFAELVGIADPDRARAAQVARQFNIPAVYGSLSEMASAAPDVIHILTPPALHAGLAIEAMDMGCHVFVEKPMAETVADCDLMIAKARETGRVLSVNHSARMDPIVLQALDRIDSGAIGRVLSVNFFRSSDYPPYPGGPVIPAPFCKGSYPFQDLGVHGLYLMEAFLGPIESAAVRYYSTGLDPNLFFDEWHASLECSRGPAHLYFSWNVRPVQNEVVVHGAKGVMYIDCYLQTLTVRKVMPAPKPIQRIAGAGLNSLSMLGKVTANTIKFATKRLLPSPGIHVSVVKFYEALAKRENPPVSSDEGRRMIAILEDVSQRANAEKERRLTSLAPLRRPRILVTGSTGLLGTALLRRLRQSGEPLRLLVRRPPADPAADPDLHLVYGDLGDPAAVERAMDGIELVYHLGAAKRGAPADFECGTVWGARNIVDACIRQKVRKLVYISSMSVLDHAGRPDGVTVDEHWRYEPFPEQRGAYTQTKLAAEKVVIQAASEQGLAAVILRPGHIYGNGTERTAPSGAIALGRWIVIGSGARRVPLVHIENVVDAILLAAETNLPPGAIFHLADPGGATQKDYVAWCAGKPGPPVHVSYVPEWVMYSLALGVELLGKALKRGVPLSRYRIRSIKPLWPCDCSAAARDLGWTPRITIEEGLS